MSKKLIIAVALLLVAAVVLCACENKKYTQVDKVTGDNGEEIIIYEDEEGSKYVDNKDGEKVPVTSDPDGFYDNLTSIVDQSTTEATDDNTENSESDGFVIGDGEQGEASISYDDIASVS